MLQLQIKMLSDSPPPSLPLVKFDYIVCSSNGFKQTVAATIGSSKAVKIHYRD